MAWLRRIRSWDPVPVLVLALLAALLLGGWWLFPKLYELVSYRDCVASGRTDCMQLEAPAR